MKPWEVAIEMLKVAAVVAIAIIVLQLIGCSLMVKAGLKQMSDEWCAAHPEASLDRCNTHQAIDNAAKVGK